MLHHRPEDFVTDQFREELGKEGDYADSDDLENDRRILIIPAVFIAVILFSGYAKKLKLARTGWHKKMDS